MKLEMLMVVGEDIAQGHLMAIDDGTGKLVTYDARVHGHDAVGCARCPLVKGETIDLTDHGQVSGP